MPVWLKDFIARARYFIAKAKVLFGRWIGPELEGRWKNGMLIFRVLTYYRRAVLLPIVLLFLLPFYSEFLTPDSAPLLEAPAIPFIKYLFTFLFGLFLIGIVVFAPVTTYVFDTKNQAFYRERRNLFTFYRFLAVPFKRVTRVSLQTQEYEDDKYLHMIRLEFASGRKPVEIGAYLQLEQAQLALKKIYKAMDR